MLVSFFMTFQNNFNTSQNNPLNSSLSSDPSKRRLKLTEEEKKILIELKERKFSYKQMERKINRSIGTIRSFFSRMKVQTISHKIGRKTRIDEEIGNFIIFCVEQQNTLMLTEIQEKLRMQKQLEIAIKTISRFLCKKKLTRKLVQKVPIERNTTQTIEKRFEYSNWYFSLNTTQPNKDIIFIDESGFNLHIQRARGRSIPGTSPTNEIPASPGPNLTLLQAINKQRVIYYEIFIGSINAETYTRFLSGLLERIDIENSILIWDNARIHHARVTKEFCEAFGVNYKFLPPYSPFLNPIEFSFSKIKKFVSSRMINNSRNELICAMTEGILSITTEDLEGYFRKSQSYFHRCFSREIILF